MVMSDMKICAKMMNLIKSANNRGIKINLSFQALKEVLESDICYFTGELLNRIENDDMQHTIDRLDNDKGYVDGNIVACSRYFNEIKKNLTLDQIKILYEKLNDANLIGDKTESINIHEYYIVYDKVNSDNFETVFSDKYLRIITSKKGSEYKFKDGEIASRNKFYDYKEAVKYANDLANKNNMKFLDYNFYDENGLSDNYNYLD